MSLCVCVCACRTPELVDFFQPNRGSADGTFWMLREDFNAHFNGKSLKKHTRARFQTIRGWDNEDKDERFYLEEKQSRVCVPCAQRKVLRR